MASKRARQMHNYRMNSIFWGADASTVKITVVAFFPVRFIVHSDRVFDRAAFGLC